MLCDRQTVRGRPPDVAQCKGDPARREEVAKVITGVHHRGITVSNLERSIEFYHEVLGLEFATEPTDVFSGEDLSRGLGVPGASLRLAMLKAGDADVELLEYVTPE